jgi:hypothetical protein
LREDARSAGDVSTIAFVAGGVLLTGGLVLYLTAPPSDASATAGHLKVATQVGPNQAGLSFGGSW